MEATYGVVRSNLWKYGISAHYRFYEGYYDYIKDNRRLVQMEYAEFKDAPVKYASNIGVSGDLELLLVHIGLNFALGINLYKPFYEVDWKESQGFFFTVKTEKGLVIQNKLEKLSTYYQIKKYVLSRLGIKYYLKSVNYFQRHNLFIAAHLNANLGQADFSELSLGYIHQFD